MAGVALRLEGLTAGWLMLESAVAIGAGIAAHSLSLVAFGADSVVELASAGVLVWRLIVEVKRGEAFPASVERRASRIAGMLLFVLAAYILASAVYGLWRHRGQDFSFPGMILAALAIPIMLVLARAKRRIAEQIGSGSLRADAAESVACAWLSGAVVAGLLAQLATGAWWVDSVTALAIVGFLVKEGVEACRDEDKTDPT